MFKISDEILIDTVNALNKALMHLEDCYEFMGTFEHEHLGRTKQFMNDKESSMKHARDAIQALESRLEEEGYEQTTDTGQWLQIDEGVFYDEDCGNWYHSWLKMVANKIKWGMSKEDIRCSLDIESDEATMYWTTFYID